MIQTNELKENEILMIGVSPDGKITSCVFNDKGEKLKEKFIFQLSNNEVEKLGKISTFYFEAEPRYLKTKIGADFIRLEPVKPVPEKCSMMSEKEFFISRFVLRKILENEIKKGALIIEQEQTSNKK